ncbi:hypothetical protein CKM354_000819900 [Cercospora kikuchii]|uniref:Uncharacterized protein n=1 Tax=Cercospora kikuchii TaxID=84275 RepID=A0A9P3FJK9_9PEZI|nr:uncharacterized protein CKM354_000819900 [Cercospora kikuchii]GIZ45015.1 hypothetical protein CKM354_000819900 [Cercospora kikuchii]
MATINEAIEIASESGGEEELPQVLSTSAIKASASVPPPSVAHDVEATPTPAQVPPPALLPADDTVHEVAATSAAPARPTNFQPTPRRLYDLPEYADRYTPVFSTLEQVVYRDPYAFSIKPPCWEKWKPEEYRAFADYLGLVDLKPLSRSLGKPVEEIYHMYHTLVTGPLLDASNASRRGEAGMKSLFELHNNHGTPNRSWTAEGIRAEFGEVSFLTVHLILEESGIKRKIKLADLTNDDLSWIQQNVPLEQRQILSGINHGTANKHDTEDGLPPCVTLKRKASPELETRKSAKQARLMESNTAPAKLRATPSTFSNTPNDVAASGQRPATPSRPQQTSQQRSAPLQAQSPASPSGPDTPAAKPSLLAKFRAPSPKSLYRKWTDVGLDAQFFDTAPSTVVLLERSSNEQIAISRYAMNDDDKKWLNYMRDGKHIDIHAWKPLVKSRSLGTSDAFRSWTAQEVIARFESVSRRSVHVLRLSDRFQATIKLADLTEADKDYVQEHVSLADMRTLFSRSQATAQAAASQVADERAATAVNDGAEEEANGVRDAAVSERDAQPIRHDSVSHQAVNPVRDVDSPLPEGESVQHPDEVITGAPPRSWTNRKLAGKLEGISKQQVFLRLENKQGLYLFPIEEWSREDYDWLKGYLTLEQRKVLSGKAA